jgi:hypothetical protein
MLISFVVRAVPPDKTYLATVYFVALYKIEYSSVLVLRASQKFFYEDIQMQAMKSERGIDDIPMLFYFNHSRSLVN